VDASPSGALALEQTTDGGETWAPASLTCSSEAPCVRWGPAPSGIGSCAMHGYPQPIEVSSDGGHTWTEPDWPGGANACDTNLLAALGPDTVALVGGGMEPSGPYPLRLSRDGGRTWHHVALPEAPHAEGGPQWFPDLQMLPDGRLLFRDSQRAYLLLPGRSQWCETCARSAPGGLPGQGVALTVAGLRVWWLEQTAGGSAQQVRSVPLTDLACGG